jgi:hypothetical protein
MASLFIEVNRSIIITYNIYLLVLIDFKFSVTKSFMPPLFMLSMCLRISLTADCRWLMEELVLVLWCVQGWVLLLNLE